MKQSSLLLVLFLLFFAASYSQNVPQGMKYQAVARNLAGNVIGNQEISLKVSLLTKGDAGLVYYAEVHTVTTNQLGLFNLVIGSGKAENGTFRSVPWSTDDIWMEVAIKDKGKSDFAMISSSKLFAVPYAFHSGTASELVGNSRGTPIANGTSPSSPANTSNGNSWNAGGNIGTDPVVNYLGTADNVSFIIKTNALERLKIAADGNIDIRRSLSIGANLNVDSSVQLNKAINGGSTINYGSFTVERQSPTTLTGNLTVTNQKPTILSGTLTADLHTQLNSSLTANGITNLNSNLNVNNASPTLLTGTLRVNKTVQIDSTLNSDSTKKSNNRVIPNGALVVMGGVGIDSNLNVNGDARFGGKASFGGAVNISDPTPSRSTGTGALVVAGGVGIGKQLNVGDSTQLNSALGVTGATSLASTLGVAGVTSLNNTTSSTSSTTGALKVAGGAGIAENLNVAGTLTTTGAATINNLLTVNGSDDYVARFNNTADKNGIAIKINTSEAKNKNNFVTFQDGNNNVVGRIEGQNLSELRGDPDYQLELASKSYDVISGAIDIGLATVGLIQAVSWNVGAAASANVCAGLGVVACPPIASLIAVSISNVVIAGVEEALVIAETIMAATNLGLFVTNKENSRGVTYQSGSGDYAEFLMKQQPNEKFMPGDIVGVRGGRISKTIAGAERVMVVSYKPIVLGNTPSAEAEKNYEKIAFMGQVPVKVTGKVNLGDYIIPNGLNNGVGIAVSPSDINIKDVKNIVGIAWSTSENAIGLQNITVAIGLNVNDNQKIIENQQNEIEELKNEIVQTNLQLEKLVPGFKAPNKNAAGKIATLTPMARNGFSSRNVARVTMADKNEDVPVTLNYPVMTENEIQYATITRTDFNNAFDIAEANMKNSVHKEKFEKFWNRFHSDAAYKEETINNLMKQYKVALDNQKAADVRINQRKK